jgi:hypothetical protein
MLRFLVPVRFMPTVVGGAMVDLLGPNRVAAVVAVPEE